MKKFSFNLSLFTRISKNILVVSALMLFLFSYEMSAQEIKTDNRSQVSFGIVHDLIHAEKADENGKFWDGGYYTENPFVTIKCEGNVTELSEFLVTIHKSHNIVRSSNGYTLLEWALEDKDELFDFKDLLIEGEVTFETNIPGCYQMAYCAFDKSGEIVLTGNIKFDSLYDDGNWEYFGKASISSKRLMYSYDFAHIFYSNGTGFLESEGDTIWWNCPLHYPYYDGEEWEVNLEYNCYLKKYRIVDPFCSNLIFLDYIPDDEELLCNHYDNVAYLKEAFIFDRENPAWLLINAENEKDVYCEPMRTGIMSLHAYTPNRFYAQRYKEKIGNVIYDAPCMQNLQDSKTFCDFVLDENDALIKVKFPENSSVSQINEIQNSQNKYYDIFGRHSSGNTKNKIIIESSNSGYRKILKH